MQSTRITCRPPSRIRKWNQLSQSRRTLKIRTLEVNEYLRNLRKESEIPIIDHGKSINPTKQLNRKKLHLNEKGSFILGKTFLDHFKFLFD